jgi:Ethanolamine utilization protein EutJ (predicted chaperonin)
MLKAAPALFLLAAACSGGDGSDTDTDAADSALPVLDPALEIGTGTVAFEPISDGDTIYIVRGPQGGYHFDISLRAQGIDPGNDQDLFDPSNPTTVWRAFDEGVQVDVGIEATQGLDPVPGEPGVYQIIGRKLILDVMSDAELDGHEVTVEVDITDSDGVELHDERTLTAIPDPLN